MRLALGAIRGEIMSMMMSQAMMPVLTGIAVGVIGSTAVTRLLTSYLFQVTATDPWILPPC